MSDLIERVAEAIYSSVDSLTMFQARHAATKAIEAARIDTLERKLAVKDEALREILGATDVRIHAIARAALEVSDTQGGEASA